MKKQLSAEQIEEMAVEIREFLLENNLWIDVRIYFNGKAFSTDDRKGNYAYNDRSRLFVLEDINPKDYFEYVGDILSMSFEGDLCGCLNFYGEYGYKFDDFVTNSLRDIFAKRGLYYEQGNHWNLSVYPEWQAD